MENIPAVGLIYLFVEFLRGIVPDRFLVTDGSQTGPRRVLLLVLFATVIVGLLLGIADPHNLRAFTAAVIMLFVQAVTADQVLKKLIPGDLGAQPISKAITKITGTGNGTTTPPTPTAFFDAPATPPVPPTTP